VSVESQLKRIFAFKNFFVNSCDIDCMVMRFNCVILHQPLISLSSQQTKSQVERMSEMNSNFDFDEPDAFALLKPSIQVSAARQAPFAHSKHTNAAIILKASEMRSKEERIYDLEQQPHEGHNNSAIALTRHYDRRRDLERTELTIRSLFTKHALKEVIKNSPILRIGFSFASSVLVSAHELLLL
jgi:hypothetical protein